MLTTDRATGDGSAEARELYRLKEDIRELRASALRNKEKLERLRQKNQERERVLQDCDDDITTVKNDVAKSERGSGDMPQGQRGEEQIGTEVKQQVEDLLKLRIPSMSVSAERPAEDDEDEGAADQNDDGANTDPSKEHDTVAVTYKMEGGVSHDEHDERAAYKATIRIDHETTVESLLKDVCTYWGCSTSEHALIKYEHFKTERRLEVKVVWADDLHKNGAWGHTRDDVLAITKVETNEPSGILSEVPRVSITKDTKLVGSGSKSILKPTEKAQLCLIRKKNFKPLKDALKDHDPNELEDEGHEHDSALLTESKKGVKAEKMDEPYVSLLEPWPGLYHLFKSRPHEHNQAWHRSRLLDFMCYGIFLFISVLAMAFRNVHDAYQLRQGVFEALVAGVPRETSLIGNQTILVTEAVQPFATIEQHEDVWAWLAGSFHFQVFNESSTLRQHYMPVGFMRVRQQKVKERDCVLDGVPDALKPEACYHIEVLADTQQMRDLALDASLFPDAAPARLTSPDPLKWTDSSVSTQNLPGRIQYEYTGEGYMMDYGLATLVSGALSTEVLDQASKQFQSDLESIRLYWVDYQTRVLVVEMALANYNLGGYISANFLIEMSAGGAVSTTHWIYPFFLQNTWGDTTAFVLEHFRFILVLLYVGIVGMYYRLHERTRADIPARGDSQSNPTKRRQSGFKYVFSAYGLTDAAIIGLSTAIWFMRVKATPQEPAEMDRFWSYAFFAHVQERLGVAESMLCSLTTCRFAALFAMDPFIYRFFKVMRMSFHLFPHFFAVFAPVFFGLVFLGNTIWSSHLWKYSRWSTSLVTTFESLQQTTDVFELDENSHNETIPFVLLSFMTCQIFLVGLFLSITVYAYFEVEVMDGAHPRIAHWEREQWLDWALWPPLYRKLRGSGAGASWKDNSQRTADTNDQGEDDEDDDDDGDDDEEDDGEVDGDRDRH